MAGRLVRFARVVAVLWLVVALSSILEMIGDCGDEEHAVQTAAAVCVHADGGFHESESSRARRPTITLRLRGCGCGCHHVSLLALMHHLETVARVTFHRDFFRLRIVDRPDAPLVRPPIAG